MMYSNMHVIKILQANAAVKFKIITPHGVIPAKKRHIDRSPRQLLGIEKLPIRSFCPIVTGIFSCDCVLLILVSSIAVNQLCDVLEF